MFLVSSFLRCFVLRFSIVRFCRRYVYALPRSFVFCVLSVSPFLLILVLSFGVVSCSSFLYYPCASVYARVLFVVPSVLMFFVSSFVRFFLSSVRRFSCFFVSPCFTFSPFLSSQLSRRCLLYYFLTLHVVPSSVRVCVFLLFQVFGFLLFLIPYVSPFSTFLVICVFVVAKRLPFSHVLLVLCVSFPQCPVFRSFRKFLNLTVSRCLGFFASLFLTFVRF